MRYCRNLKLLSLQSCAYRAISTSLSRLIPMLAERRRQNFPKQPSKKLRRLLVEKRNYRTAHLHQGVTRMNHYRHHTPRLLQILKPGNLFPSPKGLLPSNLRNPCLSRRTLTHRDPKHLHRQIVIQPSPARARGQPLLGYHQVLRLFLTAPSRQRWINRSHRISLRVPRRNRHLHFLVPCRVT
jgi:hypothetical protein